MARALWIAGPAGEGTRVRTAWIAGLTVALLAGSALSPGPASASTAWVVSLMAGGRGQAGAAAAPGQPTTTAASCPSPFGTTIKLTWTAVAHATGYTVYQATAAAAGPYTQVASASGTTWTSGSLGSGHYWYQVKALVGTAWVSASSATTTQRTIGPGSSCS